MNDEPAFPVVSFADLLLAGQSLGSDRAMRMATAVNTANTRLGVPICMSSLTRKWIDQPRSIAGNIQSTVGATRRPLRMANQNNREACNPKAITVMARVQSGLVGEAFLAEVEAQGLPTSFSIFVGNHTIGANPPAMSSLLPTRTVRSQLMGRGSTTQVCWSRPM